jgi:hypothetical protein
MMNEGGLMIVWNQYSRYAMPVMSLPGQSIRIVPVDA